MAKNKFVNPYIERGKRAEATKKITVTIQVHVHDEDLGKVIGRGGRTATALRTLVAGIGGRGIRVDVVDTDQ